MEQRNLIIAIVLSGLILLGWQIFFPTPVPQPRTQQTVQKEIPANSASAPSVEKSDTKIISREEALQASPRLKINTPKLLGSVALKGAKIDDLILKDYREHPETNSPPIALLSPADTEHAFFADFGWVAEDKSISLPNRDSLWKSDQTELGVGRPVTLIWDNGQGLTFIRTITVDEHYMFTISDGVENKSFGKPVSLIPYGRVTRFGTPKTVGTYVLHEGPIGVLDGALQEIKYKKLQEGETEKFVSPGGWLGITDKYWLVSMIVPESRKINASFHYVAKENTYQSDFIGEALNIAPGEKAGVEGSLFAGAKEVKLLDHYRDNRNIPLFDRAVDFGWFYFLTKPLFYVLDWLYLLFGNFGLAILGLTVLVKTVMFPLANKSYKSMSKMKLLQPQMQAIKERIGDDRQKMQIEMMALYKREKVNPAAGCLPIVVQIPVFYSLYKVLYVTIEMRHAPFFGWIKDLSSPDPTSILNLFGLAPWNIPDLGPLHFLSIGIWPLIMGFTMWLQQRLNPTPPDPIQARMFALMPIVFTFMLAPFAAGLVIYWAWNNSLSIIQQRFIMWRVETAKA